jgi:biopolymer transport protein ExbD
MNDAGFLIRFIDIGLIILFGFIWVSDITTFTHIDMSGDEQEQQTQKNERLAILEVQVNRGGLFAVTNQESGAIECENVRRDELQSCLSRADRELAQRNKRAVVLISPSEASAVQHTVDVLDVCQRLGIPKNINKDPLQL